MAVKIKLKRLGKIRAPHYRIVVADSRTKRDGRAIEEIGKYHPTQDPSLHRGRLRARRSTGSASAPSRPSRSLAILKVTGDWQKFKGLPAPAPLQVAEPGRQEGRLRGRRQGVGDRRTAPSRRARRRPRRPAEAERRAAAEAARHAEAADAPAAEATAAAAEAEATPATAQTEAPGRRPSSTARPERARGGSRAPRQGHRRPPGRRAVARPQRCAAARVLEVRVHPDDLGKVIGRNGRTATALRTVVGALAAGPRRPRRLRRRRPSAVSRRPWHAARCEG